MLNRLPLAFVLAVLFLPAAAGQQPPAEADAGVRPIRLIDRDEIRVSRVELQPGAVRRVHVHDDVEYHVWAPVSGKLEITIGQGPAQAAAPGQAFFMKKGTPHGFRNVGTEPAAVFEIFVKRSTVAQADGIRPEEVLAALVETAVPAAAAATQK
jgi:quercetin dioxygenase-like cupin family protein